ncbi:hypothetical protein [Kribbella sp. DT2]|uniref:hypothetical protein n=1 Tax=Kribbella sp. DT2 TaxID=3393427 RepID=UPI003CF0278E
MTWGTRTSRSRRRGRRSAGWLVIGGFLAVGGLQAGPVAAVAPPPSAPAKKPEATAAQRAAASGKPVEVVEKRTETSKSFANPDGSFTLQQSAEPVRKKRDGQWVDLDPTLSREDGVVKPAATAMDMEFSDGGDTHLVTLSKAGHEFSLTWPQPLPEPVIDGDNMTYKSVYPDVDLRVNVTNDSFSQVLIVNTEAAAKLPQLQQIELGLDAPNLTVQHSPGGGIQAVDELGTTIFSAPKPVMWDSSGDKKADSPSSDRAEEPLEGDTVAPMPVAVAQDSLAITPDRALVDAADTVYPLHIDPVVKGTRVARSMINEHYPSTPTWGWGGDEGVGYQAFEPWSRKRLFFGFDVAKIARAKILSATFTAYETWAASCTPKVVEVWKTARVTENTNWAAGSGSSVWQQRLGIATVAHGREGCDPGGAWVPFNVQSAVAQQAAANASTVYLGMRAADESDQNAWKRFRYNPELSVTYNFAPTVVRPRTEDPVTSCVTTSTNAPIMGDSQPRMVVGVTDPDAWDGDQAMVEFEVRRNIDEGPYRKVKTAGYQNTGSSVRFMPSGEIQALDSNVVYAWRARAWDGDSHSAWSTECYFKVDLTKPPAPTVTAVTAGPYTLGKAVTFKITSPSADVTGFRYAFDTFSPGATVIPKANGTLTATPTHVGPWWVRAWSVDAAGNRSDDHGDVTLRIAGPDTDGKWLLDEGTGTSSADSTGNNRTMYLGTGAEWVGGDKEGATPPDWSVFLPGLQTSGATTATTATNVVDTGNNFSVMARVQLGIKSNRQVVLSEDRPGLSSFTLGTTEMTWTGKDTPDPADDVPSDRHVKYSFTIATTGSGGPAKLETDWLPYTEGKWVSLIAVYEAGAHWMELFVDGHSRSSGWIPEDRSVTDGAGPFRTGLAIDGGTTHFFRGAVDDIRLYKNVIDDSIIEAYSLGSN